MDWLNQIWDWLKQPEIAGAVAAMLDIVEDWIALGAAIAAILAVVYAKATVNAANRANEIALHSEKLKTYKGILGIRSLVQRDGKTLCVSDLQSKYDYVEMVEFYFDKALNDRVRKYYNLCKAIEGSRDLLEEAVQHENDEQAKTFHKQLTDQFNSCVDLGNEVTEELRNDLKIHSPRK